MGVGLLLVLFAVDVAYVAIVYALLGFGGFAFLIWYWWIVPLLDAGIIIVRYLMQNRGKKQKKGR